MSRGQMLHGQLSPWQLESVLNVHRNLPLKFHQNRVSNSWDIANIEFLWWGGVGWVGFAESFSLQTQPLCCVVLGLGFWQFHVCCFWIQFDGGLTNCALICLVYFYVVIETLNPDQSFVTNLANKYFLTVNLLMSVKLSFTSKVFPQVWHKKVMVDL